MHYSAFEYLKPTDEQQHDMSVVRKAAAEFAMVLENHVPSGPDLTYCLRLLRTTTMWANVSITRGADGTPRA